MKKIIIFQGSLGNSKAIYNYIKKENYKNLKLIFINYEKKVTSKKLRLIRFYMGIFNEIGYYRFLRALIKKDIKIVCEGFSNFYPYISKEIVFINHGWGTKKSPGNNEKLDEKINLRNQKIIDSIKYIICNSDFDSTYYFKNGNYKNLDKLKFIPLGTPRNDYFFNSNKEYVNTLKLELLGKDILDYKIMLYAPTHRETIDNNKKFMDKIINEFNIIDDKLKNNKTVLLFRPHYFNENINEIFKNYRYIKLVDSYKYPDNRDLMIISDCLITDYSSIYVDYLLLKKPILFYMFDYEEYNNMRGLVIEKNNKIHCPGDHINSLIDILDIDIKKYSLEKSIEFFHGSYSGKAIESISKFIIYN
ncbi:CDP-glycerol glycerophosphotransferase family protein [Clostridium thermobutyricum]